MNLSNIFIFMIALICPCNKQYFTMNGYKIQKRRIVPSNDDDFVLV